MPEGEFGAGRGIPSSGVSRLLSLEGEERLVARFFKGSGVASAAARGELDFSVAESFIAIKREFRSLPGEGRKKGGRGRG
jgi:hypothetical protein